jgi:hypothetical protein
MHIAHPHQRINGLVIIVDTLPILWIVKLHFGMVHYYGALALHFNLDDWIPAV